MFSALDPWGLWQLVHIPSVKRCVGFLEGASRLAGFRVALVAEFTFFLVQQSGIGGRMGRVAGETTGLAFDRRVRVDHRLAGIFMTIKTESIPLPQEQNLLFRGVRIMAGKAAARLEGRMLYGSIALDRPLIMAVEADFSAAAFREKGSLADASW